MNDRNAEILFALLGFLLGAIFAGGAGYAYVRTEQAEIARAHAEVTRLDHSLTERDARIAKAIETLRAPQ